MAQIYMRLSRLTKAYARRSASFQLFPKVPEKQRTEWSRFMNEYFKKRSNLRCVFHLIDSRHGLVDEDDRIMAECADIFGSAERSSVKYVVVLTKADKNDKTGKGKAGGGVIGAVREKMRKCGVASSPIIVTSSESKLGRDDCWRYLRLAAMLQS